MRMLATLLLMPIALSGLLAIEVAVEMNVVLATSSPSADTYSAAASS